MTKEITVEEWKQLEKELMEGIEVEDSVEVLQQGMNVMEKAIQAINAKLEAKKEPCKHNTIIDWHDGHNLCRDCNHIVSSDGKKTYGKLC